MNDIIRITEEEQTTETYPMGMREMQHKAYKRKNSQYILIKAPPAAGKSRALMFLALDKLNTQGISKVIISVPERSIGGSFKSTNLTDRGFPWDWELNDKYNLCEDKPRKGNILASFLNDKEEKILICVSATLKNVIGSIDIEKFDNCLIAIDEFHHAMTDDEKGDNVLGSKLRELINRGNAHVIGMTGSYIRGDGHDILNKNYESKFDTVEYTFYEQLCSFKYLKGISYDYRFYSDSDYVNSIKENLNLDKKTIIYLPHVNSNAAKGIDKNDAVQEIYNGIGKFLLRDPVNCIDYFRTKEGKILRVCNFVNDNPSDRSKYLEYTSDLSNKDKLDIIIALNMAKEGFDWPWCEEVIVTNYRGSPTEVIQIFGRVSRDCPGKEEGRFVYLIPRPNLGNNELVTETNSLLKAITISLLMKNIATKKYYFVKKDKLKLPISDDDFILDPAGNGEIHGEKKKDNTKRVIVDEHEGATDNAVEILNKDQKDIIEKITIQCPSIKELILGGGSQKLLVDMEIPNIIRGIYKEDVDDVEIEFISKTIYYAMSKQFGKREDDNDKESTVTWEKQFNIGNGFVKYLSIDDYYINTIKEKNILEGEFQIISRAIDKELLLEMSNQVKAKERNFTDEEVMEHAQAISDFFEEYGEMPNPNSKDRYEEKLGLMSLRLGYLIHLEQTRSENN